MQVVWQHYGCRQKINPEQGHDAVNDKKLKNAGLLMEFGRHEVEQFHLLLRGVSSGVENVIQNGFLIQIKSEMKCDRI